MSYVRKQVDQFVDAMAQRKIPSPAAGSSMGLSFAMACALIEMMLSELVEKGCSLPQSNPTFDLDCVRRWREEGKKLIDDDIRAVEKMLRDKEDVESAALLAPLRRLHHLAEELGQLIIPYLAVASDKVSDIVVALLYVRTVLLGTGHILAFNCQMMNTELSLSDDWNASIADWDHKIRTAFLQVGL